MLSTFSHEEATSTPGIRLQAIRSRLGGRTMEIETFLAGNVSLGIASVIFMVIIGWVNRPFLRDVWRDPDRLWRVIARLALIANAALVLWIIVQDNWRQLSGTPYRSIQLFPSKRVEYNPPPENVRQITFILL